MRSNFFVAPHDKGLFFIDHRLRYTRTQLSQSRFVHSLDPLVPPPRLPSGFASRTIFRLDLSPGTAGGYTPLCHIQDYCLNACGIDPDTNQIFCSQRPEGSENLVRVDEVPDILARLTSGTLNQFQPVSGNLPKCFEYFVFFSC